MAVEKVHNFVLLKINGKTDASNGPGELATRLLLGHLPFMVADAARVAPLYQLLEAYYEGPRRSTDKNPRFVSSS